MNTHYALTSAMATQRRDQIRAAAERHSRLHGLDETAEVARVRVRRGWVRVLTSTLQARLS